MWALAVHGVTKSRTRLSEFPFTFHFHTLEKEMATHSSVFAWRIPGTGSLVGCCLWGRTELDTTEVTWQQQQQDSETPSMFAQAVQCPALEDASHNWCCSAYPVQPSTATSLTSALVVSEVLLQSSKIKENMWHLLCL